jgi:hypothetical protein
MPAYIFLWVDTSSIRKKCLLYRDEILTSEWILFNHQLGPLARVSLAFFFVAFQ